MLLTVWVKLYRFVVRETLRFFYEPMEKTKEINKYADKDISVLLAYILKLKQSRDDILKVYD